MANSFSKEERVAFENILEGFQDALVLSRNVAVFNTDQTTMERTNNVMWRPQPYIATSYAGTDMTTNKGQLLQDPFLNTLRKEHVPVSIYLVNGIKLQGHIESFDQYVVLLRNTVTQMVYKHAISTVVPGRPVTFSAADPVDQA